MSVDENNYRDRYWSSYELEYAKDHEKSADNWEFGEIINLLNPHENDKILDIGCNTGEFCCLLKEAFHAHPSGIDINLKAIENARMKYQDIDFDLQNVYSLDNPQTYDSITLIEVIEHLARPQEALLRIRVSLSDNGTLVISTPNKWAYLHKLSCLARGEKFLYDPTHVQEFSPCSLRNLLIKSGFSVEIIYTKVLIPHLRRFSPELELRLNSSLFGAILFCKAHKV